MDLANLIAGLKSRFGHLVECVLNRLALVSGKGFNQRLAYCLPTRAEAGVRNCISPLGADHRGEDTIASFGQSGVRILYIAAESRAGGPQDQQLLQSTGDQSCFTRSNSPGGAQLATA